MSRKVEMSLIAVSYIYIIMGIDSVRAMKSGAIDG